MIMALVARLLTLVIGTLYPAYASYKTIKSKNYKRYVKWMMYWITHAMFICIESVTDIFLAWLPNYYVIKFIITAWLLLPGLGSSVFYQKIVHPALQLREPIIDENIKHMQLFGYNVVIRLGTECIRYIGKAVKQAIANTLEYNCGVRSKLYQMTPRSQIVNIDSSSHNNTNGETNADNNVTIGQTTTNAPHTQSLLHAAAIEPEINVVDSYSEISIISQPPDHCCRLNNNKKQLNNTDNQDKPPEYKPNNKGDGNESKLRVVSAKKQNCDKKGEHDANEPKKRVVIKRKKKCSQVKSSELKSSKDNQCNSLKCTNRPGNRDSSTSSNSN